MVPANCTLQEMAGNTNTHTHDDLLTKLNFNFGHIFDLELINCVASEMNWDETKSIGALQLLCGEIKIPPTNEEAMSKEMVEPRPMTSIENTVLKNVSNEDFKEDEMEFGSNFDQATAKLVNQPYHSRSPSKRKSVVDSSVKSRQFDVDACQLFSFESVSNLLREKKNRGKFGEPKKCLNSDTIIDKIHYSIINGVKIMIIMRGCPGSGKSTLARSIIKSTLGDDFKQYIFSTDDFFVRGGGHGQFSFNPARLSEAHAWNQQRALDTVQKGKSPIIIDNTNLELWEMKPYVSMAVSHGYLVELLEPFTAWRYNVGELSKKNVHNVPRQHIKNMMDRFLKNINSSTLLKLLNFNYSPSNKPPQFVKCPLVSHQRKSHRTRTHRQRVLKSANSEFEKESEKLLFAESKLEYSDHNCEMKDALLDSDTSSCYDHFSELNIVNVISENDSKLHNPDFIANLTTTPADAHVHEHSKCVSKIGGESCQVNTNERFETRCTNESLAKFQSALNLDDHCCQQIDGFVKDGKYISFTHADTEKVEECNRTQYDKVDMTQLVTDYTDKWSQKNVLESMLGLQQHDIKLDENIDSHLDTELKSSHQVNDGITKSEEIETCLKLHNLNLSVDNASRFELGADNYEGKSSLLDESDVIKETECETHMESHKLKLQEYIDSQIDPVETESNLQWCDFDFPVENKGIPSYFFDNYSNAASNASNNSFSLSVTAKINDVNDSQKDVGLEKESNCTICVADKTIDSPNVQQTFNGCKENTLIDGAVGVDEDINSNEENSVPNEMPEIRKCECFDKDKLFVEVLNADFDKVQELDIKLCNNCATVKCTCVKDSAGFENLKKVNEYCLSEIALKPTLNNVTCNLENIEDLASWEIESLDLAIQESSDITQNVINVDNKNLISELEEDCQNSSNFEEIKKSQSEIILAELSTSSELPATKKNPDFCQPSIDFHPNLDKKEVKKDILEKISEITDNCLGEIKENVEARFKLEQNIEEKVCDWASDDKLYTWENSDNENKPAPGKKIFTPRPARTSRRPVLVKRATEDRNIFHQEPEYIPKEIETWDTVENPLASWEEITKLSVMSVGSNTHHSDFITLHKINNGEAVDPMLVKVIHCSNEHKVSQNRTSLSHVASIPKRVMLDKSTMTCIEEHFSRGLEELSSVFPNISEEYLKEIYEYCNGDFIWTVDLIMEQDPQNSENFIPLSTKPGIGVTQFNETQKPDKVNTSSKKPQKKSKNKISEESQELKKQLERNFVINDDYYSDHTLFLRNIRHPENMQNNPEDFQMPSEVVHVDDSLSSSEDTSEEEGIDMKLDTEFVKKLCTLFDGPTLSTNDFGPTLKIPKSLAVQIYYHLMEQQQSFLEQEKQKMIKEDEAFAKQLEESTCTTETVPNLREIMDMEMAMALYKTDQSQWKMESMETLAIKLSKNLLCETFPNFPKDVLLDIFSAHNYSFNDTLEVLLASSDDTQVHEVMSPEALSEHNQRLLQNAIQESKNDMSKNEIPAQQDTKLSTENANTLYQVYKDEADRHYNLRKECLNKANDAFRRGLPQVASYYSQVASLHKKQMMEASEQSTHHFFPNKLSSTTLDLHYMFVAEALRILDVFLDEHLKKLNQSANRKKVVYIITGRGQHSIGARSRIKPAVSSRLIQRKLSFMEVNEGFLKVILRRGINNSTQ